MTGFVRLSIVLTALWLAVLAVVGAQEKLTRAAYTHYFTDLVEVESAEAPDAPPRSVGGGDGRKWNPPNPDDYWGKPQQPSFQVRVFLFWLVAPVVLLWLVTLVLVPAIAWVLRGFNSRRV